MLFCYCHLRERIMTISAIDRIGTIAGFLCYSCVILPWLFIWIGGYFDIVLEYSLQLIATCTIVTGIWKAFQAILKSIIEFVEDIVALKKFLKKC